MGLPMGQKLVTLGTTGVQTLCNSETTAFIYPVQGSMELSKHVVVQHHGLMTLTLYYQGQLMKRTVSQEYEGRLTRNKKDVNW